MLTLQTQVGTLVNMHREVLEELARNRDHVSESLVTILQRFEALASKFVEEGEPTNPTGDVEEPPAQPKTNSSLFLLNAS